MKVKELIEWLNKLDPELPVVIHEFPYEGVEYYYEVTDVIFTDDKDQVLLSDMKDAGKAVTFSH